MTHITQSGQDGQGTQPNHKTSRRNITGAPLLLAGAVRTAMRLPTRGADGDSKEDRRTEQRLPVCWHRPDSGLRVRSQHTERLKDTMEKKKETEGKQKREKTQTHTHTHTYTHTHTHTRKKKHTHNNNNNNNNDNNNNNKNSNNNNNNPNPIPQIKTHATTTTLPPPPHKQPSTPSHPNTETSPSRMGGTTYVETRQRAAQEPPPP